MPGFEEARAQQAAAADAIETVAIALAALEDDLAQAKDDLAVASAEARIRAVEAGQINGKNAEDRDAQLTVILRVDDAVQEAERKVHEQTALVASCRAKLERVRMRRQEWLWVMRYEAGLDRSPLEEL